MSNGKYHKCADWLEENAADYLHSIIPFLFSVYTLWIGIWGSIRYAIWEKLEEKQFLDFWMTGKTPKIAILFFLVTLLCFVHEHWTKSKRKTELLQAKKEAHKGRNTRSQLETAQQAIEIIQNEHQDDLFDSTSDYLAHIATESLSRNDSFRISLYSHSDNRFVLAGRHSINPLYKGINRKHYPDTEGILANIWTSGGRCNIDLSDDKEERLEMSKQKYNMSKATLRSLRMDSLSYCGFAVVREDSRIGILLFESTRKGILDETILQHIFEHHQKNLGSIIVRYEKVFERLELRKEVLQND